LLLWVPIKPIHGFNGAKANIRFDPVDKKYRHKPVKYKALGDVNANSFIRS